MRLKTGSAIVDYIVPLAAIGLVLGMGLYYIFSSGVLEQFIRTSGNLNVDQTNSTAIMNPNKAEEELPVSPAGGSFGGSPENPIRTCDGSECVIDYGTFVLNGIPSNFSDYVQTSGPSGGTDKISDLLMQIATQLEKEGKEEEALDVKILATTGHNIALMQNATEKVVESCNKDMDCIADYQSKLFEKPAGFNENYYSFIKEPNYFDIAASGCVGRANYAYEDNPYAYQEALERGELNYIYADKLRELLEKNTISDDVKGVVRELSWDIGVIGEEFQDNICFIYREGSIMNHYDPLSGKHSILYPPEVDLIDQFENYEASTITHFDSALICASGYYEDTGTECH
jgi:hypothetical protein